MPLVHSGTDSAFKTNVKTLMGEIGKSPHVKSRAQALAVAYSVKRRSDGGATEDTITADFARQAAAERTRRAVTHRAGFAFGGFSPYETKPNVNRMEHAEARNMQRSPAVHTGPVLSAVAGRHDAHPTHVPSKSYVLTADHLSSLGQGNTLNGMAQINHMFKMGPAGVKPMGIKHGAGPPRPPRLQHANGGDSARGHIGQPTPVAIAGGEVVIPPAHILDWLQEHGFPRDIDFGHKVLDAWMTEERKRHIRTLKKLPGPAKS